MNSSLINIQVNNLTISIYRYDGEKYEVVKDIIKARKIQHMCTDGHILVEDVCGMSSYFLILLFMK